MIGQTLSHYRVTAQIGVGGMGEVYRATDARLDREVAIKILPASRAASPEFLARFEREARTISSLNHPHVCTLHDVGSEGAVHFLVMELIEGESVADRLKKGPLPLPEVLRFGAQIADALEAAHRSGIVHRDLKPGNVMITRSGAKLLDFGLARTPAEGSSVVSAPSTVQTEHKPLTAHGTILGTFQYMAPEQLEGLEADARTDIFAFGALLYEMATGQRAFRGESKTSLIAAIVSSQPAPVSQIVPTTPPALDHVIRTCLAKDPDERWQSARDVRAELQWIAESGSQSGAAATNLVRRKSRQWIAWALAGMLAAAAAAALGWAVQLRGALRTASRPFRAEIVPPPGTVVAPLVQGPLALSPDGRRLAFVTSGPQALVVRDLASGETKALAGTEGATFPFWSPDSRWVGFFAERKLRKLEAAGGPVQTVCDANEGRGGSWGRDGTIVFAPDIMGPLLKVASGGGTPTAATKVGPSSVTHRNPWFLPDGRHFLVTTRDTTSAQFGSVAIGSLDGGEPVVLLGRGSNPQYADGFLFTVVDGNLVAQPFDPEERALHGQAVALADGVEFLNPRDLGQYSVSVAGLAVYRRAHLRPTQLTWLDRGGKTVGTVGEPSYHGALALASDGRTLAAVRTDETGAHADVWILDLQHPQAARATFVSAASDLGTAISPDGTRLAVSASSVGGVATSVWIQSLSGSGSRQTLLEGVIFSVTGWSPDGAFLVGTTQQVGSGFDLAYVTLTKPAKLVQITPSRFDEGAPALSPDGRWMAYSSNETGSVEVFISDFPAATRKWQVSRSGGHLPTWRGDGRELYFVGSGVWAVPLTERGGALDVGEVVQLPFPIDEISFTTPGSLGGPAVRSADGKRFLVARYEKADVAEPVRFIRSWRNLVEEQGQER